jgi:putative colanic acid biosynthesis acetyltransferase WcaF
MWWKKGKMVDDLDIAANRSANKYGRSEILRRIVWSLCTPLFRFSPRPMFGWRRFLLRLFGAKIGANVHIYSSATIYMPWNLEVGAWSAIGEHAYIYNLGRVAIGKRATVSPHAYICAGTHDYAKLDMPLLKPPIAIGDKAWVCAAAFIGPGVTVGEGAIVGACAVAVKDVLPWSIVAGNPAHVIGERTLGDKTG